MVKEDSKIADEESLISDVLLIGALNLDMYAPFTSHEPETSYLCNKLPMRIGGGAAITAMALENLGVSTSIAGSVGLNSDVILRVLKESRVQTYLQMHPEVDQAVTITEHYPDGKKRFKASTESNELFTATDLKDLYSSVAKTKVVMRTGYPWMPQIAGKPTADLFEYAKSCGVMTAFDMSSPSKFDQKMLDELLEEVMPKVDLLCANDKELYILARRSDEPLFPTEYLEIHMDLDRVLEFAHRMIDIGVKTVNMHYGHRGTVIVNETRHYHGRVSVPEKYANPTGCGNLQNAGVLYSHLLNLSIEQTAMVGNAMGTLRLEGKEFPTLQEVNTRVVGYLDSHQRS